MSGTRILYTDSDCFALLKNKRDAAQRMEVIKTYIRPQAAHELAGATNRIPYETPSILALLQTKGMRTEWLLDCNVDAVKLCAVLSQYLPTDKEKRAAEILRACVYCNEGGDIPEYRTMEIGIQQRASQTGKAEARRKFDPATERLIAKSYRDSKSNRGAVKELARRFDVSTKAIREIAGRNLAE